MLSAEQLHKDLYAWAVSSAVLADVALRDTINMLGDASRVPFDDEHAVFFKTRKIVKITRNRKGASTLFSIATRLPIAHAKRAKLIQRFEQQFKAQAFLLEVIVARPFKVDQNVQATFNPVYRHKGKIACGSSIGLGNQRNAGTLGALGEAHDGRLLGISCNHVTGGCNTASVGTPIVSPGIQDVSPDNHEIVVIGLHEATGPMSQGLPQIFDISSNCDLALFEITASKQLTSMQGHGSERYDTPNAFVRIAEDLRVKKWGRSTGITRGVISKIVTEPESIEYNVISYYGPGSSQVFKGTVFYSELYEIESLSTRPFSAGGDSGALVVSDVGKQEKVVGILIGGNTTKSYVLPLRQVLKRLGVTLANGVNV